MDGEKRTIVVEFYANRNVHEYIHTYAHIYAHIRTCTHTHNTRINVYTYADITHIYITLYVKQLSLLIYIYIALNYIIVKLLTCYNISY